METDLSHIAYLDENELLDLTYRIFDNADGRRWISGMLLAVACDITNESSFKAIENQGKRSLLYGIAEMINKRGENE